MEFPARFPAQLLLRTGKLDAEGNNAMDQRLQPSQGACIMIRRIRTFPALIAISAMLLAAPVKAELQRTDVEAIVQEYLSSHPEEVQRIVKDYLVKNPEVLRDAFAELIKRRAPAAAASANSQKPEQTAAIQSNAKLLFDSAHQVALGNPHGSVTMVEFFDFNCGYCKRALADTLALLKDDADLRIVLKEYPILGPGSLESARVSIAVRMQDRSGEKYLEFHRRLLGGTGPADNSLALAVAKEIGLDVARLEQDLSSSEVRETLEENVKLAHAVGINGTPGYVIGNAIIAGAIGTAGLKERIATARTKPHE
jgi:protein-disulfide isomerase